MIFVNIISAKDQKSFGIFWIACCLILVILTWWAGLEFWYRVFVI
jgi:hypothetical protein